MFYIPDGVSPYADHPVCRAAICRIFLRLSCYSAAAQSRVDVSLYLSDTGACGVSHGAALHISCCVRRFAWDRAAVPVLLDVRPPAAFQESETITVGAQRRSPEALERWAPLLPQARLLSFTR
jgi:hypothetical protein